MIGFGVLIACGVGGAFVVSGGGELVVMVVEVGGGGGVGKALWLFCAALPNVNNRFAFLLCVWSRQL